MRRATALFLKRNSDQKTHYGLGVPRSEERGVEYKRDWNTEEDYEPSLHEGISALTQPAVEQKMDKSRWPGLSMGAEAEIRLNQWFLPANN